jgi:hypothetical protein
VVFLIFLLLPESNQEFLRDRQDSLFSFQQKVNVTPVIFFRVFMH